MKFRRVLCAVIAAAVLATSAAGCARDTARRSGGPVTLTGAGATFPFPLYSRWIADYARVEPRVRINYLSVGSGAGIRQITSRIVNFGATDAPMTDEELRRAPAPLLHIPMALGAVAVAYNLPGVGAGLNLSPEVLADLFLGKIKKWNDRRLVELNPRLTLPDRDVTVVYRTDGSGTTYIFTDYLSRVNGEWRARVGRGKAVKWPAGVGGKGNEGLTGQMRLTPGAIGYLELIYAEQNNLSVARIRNRAGRFVEPELANVTAAAAGAAADLPRDLRISIVDAPGEDAYPLSAFTYILAYREQADEARGMALARFLNWALHDGQKVADDLRYAPLPSYIVEQATEKVRSLSHRRKPLLPPARRSAFFRS